MELLFSIAFYILAFLSLYVQVFFLVTFFENLKQVKKRKGLVKLSYYPSVTVVVPCWNEERTIGKTAQSLVELNYPKDKLNIFLVDDGSTDRTWDVINNFTKYSNVKVYRKENGGKYTALNLGLLNSKSEFFGCLDADSYASLDSLVRVMSYFEKDPSVMAVAPSIIVDRPQTIIQKAQAVEYYISLYVKKMLSFVGGIHVAPGPLTIFRKAVFEKLGPYRHAHNTEDMEIAYRMQKNYFKIEQCHDAYVYTSTPLSIKKLYHQRLRWIYGFLNNTIDYRSILLRKKYGNFSVFTVPAGLISIVSVIYLLSKGIYSIGNLITEKVLQIKTVGFSLNFGLSAFDPFFISTNSILFLALMLYSLILLSILLGYKMTTENKFFAWDVVYFFSIYSVLAPLWLLKAIYNTIFTKIPSWR